MAQLDAPTLHEWSDRYSNRGRWQNDERGTLNFITRERVLAACAIPRSGVVISCALSREFGTPNRDESPSAQRDEALLRGAWGTRWHSPLRGAQEEQPYAGTEPQPFPHEGVQVLDRAAGVIGRGILLDFPRYRRLPWLEDDTRIQPADLDSCAEAFGVAPESGDIVLVRTGTLQRCKQQRSWSGYRSGPAPGLSVHCARWIYEREVAVVATDTWQTEARPSEAPDCLDPLRTICLRDTGMWFGEVFDLDELSESCASDGRYEFLFSAAPLPLGSDGAPVAPLATK
jgi:kynurenine formamidase